MNYLGIYCNFMRKAEKRGYTKKKAKELGVLIESIKELKKEIEELKNK